jgi:transcriptional regulator with XRE-family HTH domain
MTTAEAVLQIRTKIGESQQAFSNRLGVTVTTISRWEQNHVTPMPDKLAALSHMARQLDLIEAAGTLEHEAGVLFQTLGRGGLQHAWERFGQIAGRILEFRHEMKRAGITIPDDLGEGLDKAVELANFGKDDMKQLMAMVPHVGPKA